MKPKTEFKLIWYGLLILASIYLINPTAGLLEFVPDNAPLIGNLDEAGATVLFLHAWEKIRT